LLLAIAQDKINPGEEESRIYSRNTQVGGGIEEWIAEFREVFSIPELSRNYPGIIPELWGGDRTAVVGVFLPLSTAKQSV
jgi:hypothetical protein